MKGTEGMEGREEEGSKPTTRWMREGTVRCGPGDRQTDWVSRLG